MQKYEIVSNIIFDLLRKPSGKPVNSIMLEYGLSERSLRNYLKELKELAFMKDSNGKSRIVIEKEEGVRYIRLKEATLEGDDSESFIATFYMASTLLKFLSGTNVYEPVEGWVDNLKSKGVNLPIPHFEKKIFSVLERPKDYSLKGDIVKTCLKGIINQRRLIITYSPPNHPSKKHSSFLAYTLLLYRNGLYLIGKSEDIGDKIIKLSVDRIKDVKIKQGSGFQYPTTYNPKDYLSQSFGIIHEDKSYNVELLLDKDVAFIAKERKFHSTSKISDKKDGSVKLTMQVNSLTQVVPWVLSFGSKIKVIKPKELIESVKSEAKNLLKLYK